MCNLLRGFKGKLEVFRRCRLPRLDRLCVRHPVERVIDLDAVQATRVVPEKLLLGNIGRIKNGLPFLVAKARSAEPNPRHSGIIAQYGPTTPVIIGERKALSEKPTKMGVFRAFSWSVFNMP